MTTWEYYGSEINAKLRIRPSKLHTHTHLCRQGLNFILTGMMNVII